MLKFNFKQYFFLIVACALYSCQQYHRMEMKAGSSTNSSTVKYKPLKSSAMPGTEPPKFYVVLVPSFGVDASQTDAMNKELKKEFGEGIMIIQIKSLEEIAPTGSIGEPELEPLAQEVLCTLIDRFDSQGLAKASHKAYAKIPMHILGWDQASLMSHIINKTNLTSISINNAFKIKTLSVIDRVDNKYRDKGSRAIQYFNSTSDYITFLKQQ